MNRDQFASFWIAGIALLSIGIGSGGALADPIGPASVAARLSAAQPVRIVCFGDSITGAYYHTGGERAWCDLLGFALQRAIPRANLEMINAGISGHTTVNALARMDQDVIQRRPDLVVVMFGMNDVTRVSADQFQANLNTIITRCRDAGAEVVLCTPNSVVENEARPNDRLAEFARVVRGVADGAEVPVVDLFQLSRQLRDQDPERWMLGMSDEIHPNLNGHQWFAEWIAATVLGIPATLDTIHPSGESPRNSPPYDVLQHTFDRAEAGQTIKLVAMPPYDEWIPPLLREKFPEAQFEVTRWPVAGESLASMAEWAKRIRAMEPDLVIPAVPVDVVGAETDDAFVKDYEWVLNWSFQFAGRPWDVVPVCPSIDSGGIKSKGDLPVPTESLRRRVTMARKIIQGKDVGLIDFDAMTWAEPNQTHRQRVAQWMSDQHRVWRGARNRLPLRNDHLFLPAQPWPRQPGPRTVKVSIHYPGGKLDQVNSQTGIMLTLHNWGGHDCVGTADPRVLAERLNVVAVCVDYLQSGRRASTDDPAPYDFGYLQALDALGALAFVGAGLRDAGIEFDEARTFCTGGSGGGNVTLMANKLAPRTFAGVIDICGMNRLSDDIAFNQPGGSSLDARWNRDPDHPHYLSPDQQEIRFVGNPTHLNAMVRLGARGKIIVVHGVDDTACPVADAREMVANMQAAGLDVEPWFIGDQEVDGKIFTSAGHALGNRTEIVFHVAQRYLLPESPDALRRAGPSDFELRQDVVYETTGGKYVISYASGIPVGRFEPAEGPPEPLGSSASQRSGR